MKSRCGAAFWTAQVGLHFRYIGHATRWDDVRIDGDLDSGKFLARYLRDGRTLAVAGGGRDRDMAALHARMLAGGGIEAAVPPG